MFSPWKFTNPLVNWHAEIHFPARISACGTPNNEYFHTLGNPQFLVYFHMRNARSHVNFHMGKGIFPPARIYTYFCVFSHAVIHLKLCKSASADIHFSSCGNSHSTVYLRMRLYTKICVNSHSGYTHFLVHFHKWKFTIISVDPHMRKIKF